MKETFQSQDGEKTKAACLCAVQTGSGVQRRYTESELVDQYLTLASSDTYHSLGHSLISDSKDQISPIFPIERSDASSESICSFIILNLVVCTLISYE